jgi:hypothetical protein
MCVTGTLILFQASGMLDEDSDLQGCDIVPLGQWFLMFERNIMPSSSKVKQSKNWTV